MRINRPGPVLMIPPFVSPAVDGEIAGDDGVVVGRVGVVLDVDGPLGAIEIDAVLEGGDVVGGGGAELEGADDVGCRRRCPRSMVLVPLPMRTVMGLSPAEKPPPPVFHWKAPPLVPRLRVKVAAPLLCSTPPLRFRKLPEGRPAPLSAWMAPS